MSFDQLYDEMLDAELRARDTRAEAVKAPSLSVVPDESRAPEKHGEAEGAGAEAGARIFRHQCSGCHGRNAQSGRAPDLTRGGLSANALFQKISQGVPGTEMLGYRERFNPEDIRRIAAFIMAANRDESRITGDAGRGETLFWNKAGCGSCHAVGPRGNRIGKRSARARASAGRRRRSRGS